MYQLEAEMIFAEQDCSAQEMFYALESVCKNSGMEPNEYSSAHEVLEIDSAEHLHLSGTKLEAHGITMPSHKQDWFQFKSQSLGIREFVALIEALAKEAPPVQVLFHDSEYQFWQNANDPLEYEANGRSHSSLPKVSNGLPPPLNQEVIDTSANPGRFVIKQSFRESVSSPMWVRRELIQNYSLLKDIKGITIGESAGLVKISHSSMPFTSSSGVQAEAQVALRLAVFGV